MPVEGEVCKYDNSFYCVSSIDAASYVSTVDSSIKQKAMPIGFVFEDNPIPLLPMALS